MKLPDQIKQKVLNVNRIFVFLIILVYSTVGAQVCNYDKLTEAEYSLINDFFRGDKEKESNGGVLIYYKTTNTDYLEKYFRESDIGLITGEMCIPVYKSNKELENILTDVVRKGFLEAIVNDKPLKINKSCLVKNIRLRRGKKTLKIIKPIIIGNLAIFSTISHNEIPIYIMEKKNNTWQIIYTFCEKLVLE